MDKPRILIHKITPKNTRQGITDSGYFEWLRGSCTPFLTRFYSCRPAGLLLLLLLFSGSALGQDPITEQITVYLAGDSTMAAKLPEKRPETGWGEALQKFFSEDKVLIENHAQNGRSTKSFIAEKRWQAIIEKLKKGDYVFIQFGHNDESKEKGDRYTPPEEYRHNLIKFINEVRGKKAIPVLLTPVMRRRFDKDGKFFDTHGEYPDIVRAVAAENQVALIDMHRKSQKVIMQYGMEDSKKLFLQLKPGENPNYPQGVEDNTHFSPLGAEIMAGLAVEGIREAKLDMARYLKKESITWTINHLELEGEHATIIGRPGVIDTAYGKAELFNGRDDGLLVNANPLAGAGTFTVEAIFRPDPGGRKEQRWLHIQEETGDNRILLEIRLSDAEWFLDTFIKSGDKSRTLYAEHFKHPVEEWYHVALVYDGSTMRHYVDGKEELSGPLSFAPLGKGRTSIGVRMNRVYWFKGAILKARFTPHALSPQEFLEKK